MVLNNFQVTHNWLLLTLTHKLKISIIWTRGDLGPCNNLSNLTCCIRPHVVLVDLV